MSRDLKDKENEFVGALAADTGRDLAAWMHAIGQSGLSTRNDIIDWLRQQGFAFANASWLERIHNNGGRLIYDGAETRPIAPTAERAPARTAASSTPDDKAPEVTAAAGQSSPLISVPTLEVTPPVEVQPPALAPTMGGLRTFPAAIEPEIQPLLMAAKGLRPLADYVLREVELLIPALVRLPSPPFVMLSSPMPFAALLPGPKDIRLYADFGPGGRDRARKADTARFAAPFADVIVLNDARQIDDRLRELIAGAYTRALK